MDELRRVYSNKVSSGQTVGILSARDLWYEGINQWQPLPHQIPPDGIWDVWMLLGGRGSGKTMAGTHFVLDHLLSIR